jgi:hypothetical protein
MDNQKAQSNHKQLDLTWPEVVFALVAANSRLVFGLAYRSSSLELPAPEVHDDYYSFHLFFAYGIDLLMNS